MRKYIKDIRFTNALVFISQNEIKRVFYKAESETRTINGIKPKYTFKFKTEYIRYHIPINYVEKTQRKQNHTLNPFLM